MKAHRYTVVLLALVMMTGCKPYDEPEFSEIDTSETGFLIPLEGNTDAQAHFESERYLEERKVATKRVQIPHRWVQTGRMYWTGNWMGTVRLVKVDRSPVTREWTADASSGTSNRNQAIWIESKDSVGFSVGFNCTAYIKEEDTARFLYMYRSKSLADMMDTELRARIQAVGAEVAAGYDLDELRSRKLEIIEAVRADLIPFFAQRGITITTVGMFGGFTYENRAIQDAIDETFVAQQLKVISEAKFEAQEKENQRIELEAEAQANRTRTMAQGEADSIRNIAEATREAKSDPVFLQMKLLEVEQKRIDKWDGRYPQYLMSFGDDQAGRANLMLQVPSIDALKVKDDLTRHANHSIRNQPRRRSVMQRSLLHRFRPTRALLWKLVIFVAVSGTFRATEHYLLYSLHPSVTANAVVVDASGAADGGRDEAVRLYESVRNATLSVSGALIALTAVAVFSHRGGVDDEAALRPAFGRPIAAVVMQPSTPKPRKEARHARRVCC